MEPNGPELTWGIDPLCVKSPTPDWASLWFSLKTVGLVDSNAQTSGNNHLTDIQKSFLQCCHC